MLVKRWMAHDNTTNAYDIREDWLCHQCVRSFNESLPRRSAEYRQWMLDDYKNKMNESETDQ